MNASIYNRLLQAHSSIDDEKVEDSLQQNGVHQIISLYPDYLAAFELVIRDIAKKTNLEGGQNGNDEQRIVTKMVCLV